MSEPKTPDEFLREISSAFQALYPSADALDNAVGAIEARDEQIRQQAEARVREVLIDRLRHNRPRGFDEAVSEALGIGMDLGIDLEGTDDA